MMLRLGFVLVLCVYGALAYRVDYELEEMDGSVDEESAKCKRDIWILWDNSQSLGWRDFDEKAKPFLKNLITSSRLKVGPDGTHIGIITFSNESRTKVLRDLGEKQTPAEFLEFLDRFDRSKYIKELMGDRTRTGMAFKMADEKFPKQNPDNHRLGIDDVVLMLTDGEPNKGLTENSFGDKYTSRDGEKRLAKDRADDLKSRGITVVGLAIGTQTRIRKFRDDVESWVTTPVRKYYHEARLDQLQSILKQLITSTCRSPAGKCSCDVIEVAPAYTVQGEKALIHWLEPTPKCPSGNKPKIYSTAEQSGYSSPRRFGAGKHTVTYTIEYWRESKITTMKCPVEINVKNCECPSSAHVDAELQPGQNEAQVSWTVPKPNCKATLKAVSRPGAKDGEDSFPVGEHTVTYNYEHNSLHGYSFALSCPVSITVKGPPCRGVAFDPSTQACCCGTIVNRQAHHECCGPDYYDSRVKTCKDFYTLVNN